MDEPLFPPMFQTRSIAWLVVITVLLPIVTLSRTKDDAKNPWLSNPMRFLWDFEMFGMLVGFHELMVVHVVSLFFRLSSGFVQCNMPVFRLFTSGIDPQIPNNPFL